MRNARNGAVPLCIETLPVALPALSRMMEQDTIALCGPRYGHKDGEAGAGAGVRFFTTEKVRRATVGHRSRSGSSDSGYTA
jgi:hypothetical protein